MSLKQPVITARSLTLGYFLYTALGLFVAVFFYGAVADVYLGGSSGVIFSPIFFLLVPATGILSSLFGSIWLSRILKARQQKLAGYAAEHSYKFDPNTTRAQAFKVGSLDQMHNAINSKASNIVAGDDWLFYDFSYEVQNRNRRFSGPDKVYYGVMVTKLSRMLPHLLFDSLRSRKRQFRFEFVRSQRLSLEGDFDKHFVTYVPGDYEVDSLSFISPDVMLALRDADHYDIEIVGDELYLYGPLFEPSEQLEDMSRKIRVIKKELEDNIDTYLDTRVPYEVGRKVVSESGRHLRRSHLLTIVYVVGAIIWILLWFMVGGQRH